MAPGAATLKHAPAGRGRSASEWSSRSDVFRDLRQNGLMLGVGVNLR